MKTLGLTVVLLVAPLCMPVFLFAQEDASRESGFPSRIGGNRCNNTRAGADAMINGSLNVQGVTNTEKPLTMTVSLYAAGAFVSRQRVKNGGLFSFYCVPRESVMLIAEVDSIEVGNFPMGQLASPPIMNRQDIYVVWSDSRPEIKRRNEVVSVRNYYKRSEENQNLFNKAIDGLSNKKGENSTKLLGQLLEKDAADFVAWAVLGDIYFNNTRFSDADMAYEKVLALKEDFLPALIGAGRANFALRNFDRAILIFLKADEKSPNSADVNHYLGEAYLQIRKGTLAIARMRKAIEIAPDEKADLHLRIATLFNAAGAKHLAADEYKLLLQKKPNHPDKKNLEKYISENSQ